MAHNGTGEWCHNQKQITLKLSWPVDLFQTKLYNYSTDYPNLY